MSENFLRLSGLHAIGRRKALELRLEHNTLSLPTLASELNGYRLLQISDPHYPEHRDLEFERGIEWLAANTDHDITVLTGDYRDRSFGPFEGALRALESLRPHLAKRAVAVLGNHDPLDIVEPMTRLGYEVLLNQTITIEHSGACFDLLGVDDPSYYRTHNLELCLKNCRTSSRLLLAHSPDLWMRAAEAGIDAYLCGHTHGGQLCLPGGVAIRTNSDAPARMTSGVWHEGTLNGYTSRGAGTSIVNARCFCPPELALHTLTRSMKAPHD